MNHKITLSLLVAGAAATYAGFALSGKLPGGETHAEPVSIEPVIVAQAAAGTVSEPKPFNTMAVGDINSECKFRKMPPLATAETPYERAGFAATRMIMALEKWQETGSCECFINDISWEEAIVETNKYTLIGDAKRTFDLTALQNKGEAILKERKALCE